MVKEVPEPYHRLRVRRWRHKEPGDEKTEKTPFDELTVSRPPRREGVAGTHEPANMAPEEMLSQPVQPALSPASPRLQRLPARVVKYSRPELLAPTTPTGSVYCIPNLDLTQ